MNSRLPKIKIRKFKAFRVLKNNELKAHGKYRTQRLVLAAWDEQEMASGAGTQGEN